MQSTYFDPSDGLRKPYEIGVRLGDLLSSYPEKIIQSKVMFKHKPYACDLGEIKKGICSSEMMYYVEKNVHNMIASW